MPISNKCLVVRIFINNDRWGWCEEWPLNQLEWNLAVPIAYQLANARSYLLAQNCEVIWATLGQVAFPYQELPLLNSPLGPLPQWGQVFGCQRGIYWNFSTGEGRTQARIFRGLDKTEIVKDRWKRQWMVIPYGTIPAPANPATAEKEDLFKYVLAFFRDNTAAAESILPDSFGNPQWELTPWKFVDFNKLGSRRAFSNWKRASWEALVYKNAPAFSPCGMATTVIRRTYRRRCRFYVNGSSNWIHYYFAQAGADVFPLKTIFYAWDRVKANTNSTGTGEITVGSLPIFYKGPGSGGCLGTDYIGTQADFLVSRLFSGLQRRRPPLGCCLRATCRLPISFCKRTEDFSCKRMMA